MVAVSRYVNLLHEHLLGIALRVPIYWQRRIGMKKTGVKILKLWRFAGGALRKDRLRMQRKH
jgi:hypothetical protein